MAPLAVDTTGIPDLGALPDLAPSRFYDAQRTATRLAEFAAAFAVQGPIGDEPVA